MEPTFDLSFVERILEEVERKREREEKAAMLSKQHKEVPMEEAKKRTSLEIFPNDKLPEKKKASMSSSAAELARRDDCTVMVQSLHPQVDEREVYEFFSREAGKVRDVQIIREPKTGKSRGVAYVEFFLPDALLKAMACNGQLLRGVPVRVQSSQADKNRAADAHKAAVEQEAERPVKLYVCGMTGPLLAFTEDDLKRIFACFGPVSSVFIGRCPYTGRSLGFAHVVISRGADAKEAMVCMDNFEILDIHIRVGFFSGMSKITDDQEGTITTNEQRQYLMHSLANDDDMIHDEHKNRLLIRNGFDINTLLRPDANIVFNELTESIRNELCKFGDVIKIFVDKLSVDGSVWVQFKASKDAIKALSNINKHMLLGRAVKAELADADSIPN